jgi:chromosome segregation ATPase
VSAPEWERPFLTLCWCGDQQASHELDQGGCRRPDCVCDRFVESSVPTSADADREIEAADDREARRTGGTFARHYLGAVESGDRDAESTSAALRRVQAELDAERDKRDEDIAAYERACGLAVVAERERGEARDEARRLRDQLGFADARIRKLSAKRPTPHLDAVKAELASARTELDAVRAARDALDRELAEARLTIRALVGATPEQEGETA